MFSFPLPLFSVCASDLILNRSLNTRSIISGDCSPELGVWPEAFPKNCFIPNSVIKSAANAFTWFSRNGSTSSMKRILSHVFTCFFTSSSGSGHVVASFRIPTFSERSRMSTASSAYDQAQPQDMTRSSGAEGPL